MKNLFIVANWKSHKTVAETKVWLSEFSTVLSQNPAEKTVIVCPSFISLVEMNTFIKNNNFSIKIGAQNLSPFPDGAYTGEIYAGQIKEFVDYVIIGHSERRSNFSETDELLGKKVEQAIAAGVQPIFCVQSGQTPVPDGVTIVAYEPIEAIGTGHPDTPEDANAVAQAIKEQHPNVKVVLYGGSVTPEDVKGFTESAAIDGVLVGGASLDPQKFAHLIQNS